MCGNPGAWEEREKCGIWAEGDELKTRFLGAPALGCGTFTFKSLQSLQRSLPARYYCNQIDIMDVVPT